MNKKNKISDFISWWILESDTVIFASIILLYVLVGVFIGFALFFVISYL